MNFLGNSATQNKDMNKMDKKEPDTHSNGFLTIVLLSITVFV